MTYQKHGLHDQTDLVSNPACSACRMENMGQVRLSSLKKKINDEHTTKTWQSRQVMNRGLLSPLTIV